LWGILQQLDGENPQKLDEIPKNNRLEWLSECYVAGNDIYDKGGSQKDDIIELNKRVYDIQASNDHDSSLAKIYWICREWSYEGFKQLYKQLEVQDFEKFIAESEVTSKGIDLVRQGQEKGIFEESEGAIVFAGEDQGLHTRVFINSEGLPTYEAKELGLAAAKWQDYKFDKSIVITANDIVEYMKVVLTALQGFYPEVVERTTHLTHGMIKLPGNQKMSSRLGNILRAKDVLDAAAAANKHQSSKHDQAVVLGAVKYSFLKQRLGADIIYDPEESVSLEGNSGPYLQYAHARAQSILSKAGAEPAQINDLTEGERTLVRKISEFPEVVNQSVNDLMPHHICTYLYELAQTFNRFYENNRVIDDKRQAERLTLVKIYSETLKKGLSLLGIAAPDKM
jgi:arginyl-tRNA synthetase